MKTVNGHPVPSKSEIMDASNSLREKLEAVSGISLVKTNIDFNNFIATLDFNFSQIQSLNTALKKVGEKAKDQQQGFQEMFHYDEPSYTLSRLNKFELADAYRKMNIADREIFANATYTSIYRFDRLIQSSMNTKSKIAANKKAVMIKSSALDLIKGKTKMDNQITLQK